MYCPKCGTDNPEDGKYCRKCGTGIEGVVEYVDGGSFEYTDTSSGDSKSKGPSFESAFGKLFMGIAFLIVSGVLSTTMMGRMWWFWLLIPAFGMLGSGVAQIMRLNQQGAFESKKSGGQNQIGSSQNTSGKALPQGSTDFVPANHGNTKYDTGDLVPPSVVENTTRHLKMNKEGETMTLPKQEK